MWKEKSKVGRPALFSDPEVLRSQCEAYLEYCDNNPWIRKEALKSGDLAGTTMNVETKRPYTIDGLHVFLGVNKHYLNDFEKTCSPEFSDVIMEIRQIIRADQIEGGLVGAYNSNLTARINDISEKTEVKGDYDQHISLFERIDPAGE